MITGADIQSLKDYVRGPSSQNQADTTVRLQVTHSNLKAHFMEIRLDLQVSSKAATMSSWEMLQSRVMQCCSADEHRRCQAEADESYRK